MRQDTKTNRTKDKLLKQHARLVKAYEKNFQKLAHCDRNYMRYFKIEKRLNRKNITLQREIGISNWAGIPKHRREKTMTKKLIAIAIIFMLFPATTYAGRGFILTQAILYNPDDDDFHRNPPKLAIEAGYEINKHLEAGLEYATTRFKSVLKSIFTSSSY